MLEEVIKVKMKPNGRQFINGLSSSYESTYDERLRGIMDEDELKNVIQRLNHSIQEFWPCDACLYFGICCAPCTLFPCFPTNICMNEVEKHATSTLEQISLRSKYYDRRIEFRLEKKVCSSQVVISIPVSALCSTGQSCSEHLNDSPYSSLLKKSLLDIESKDGVITAANTQSHRKDV
jgi:hypothetical protein